MSHPSTNRAQRCLTSVIVRELVFLSWSKPLSPKCCLSTLNNSLKFELFSGNWPIFDLDSKKKKNFRQTTHSFPRPPSRCDKLGQMRINERSCKLHNLTKKRSRKSYTIKSAVFFKLMITFPDIKHGCVFVVKLLKTFGYFLATTLLSKRKHVLHIPSNEVQSKNAHTASRTHLYVG